MVDCLGMPHAFMQCHLSLSQLQSWNIATTAVIRYHVFFCLYLARAYSVDVLMSVLGFTPTTAKTQYYNVNTQPIVYTICKNFSNEISNPWVWHQLVAYL